MDVDTIGGTGRDVCLAVVASAVFLHQAKANVPVSGGIGFVLVHSMALVVPAS